MQTTPTAFPRNSNVDDQQKYLQLWAADKSLQA